MMRSLSSAVAGLRSHQTRMDVIGNNIANVNTYGFKASRATFADVYYQNLAASSKPNIEVSGGMNPTQIGYGAAVATIDILNTQSGSASTDRAMDIYIAGDGFLVTQDAAGNKQYSRLGILGLDASGQVIDSNGSLVLGFPVKNNGSADVDTDGTAKAEKLKPIKIDPDILDKLTGLSISPSGEIVGILPGGNKLRLAETNVYVDAATIKLNPKSNVIGDVEFKASGLPTVSDLAGALGGANITGIRMGDVVLPPSEDEDSDQVKYEVTKVSGEVILKMTKGGTTTEYTGEYKENGTFELRDSYGKVAMTIETGKGVPDDFTIPKSVTVVNHGQITGATKAGRFVKTQVLSNTSFEYDGFSFTVNATKVAEDLAAGKEVKFKVATVAQSDGDKLTVGHIALARFQNAAGLQQNGQSYFLDTPNSGEPQFSRPGINGTGKLKSNYLEMSNVDISKEFTEMITTQRGFQANTRIVTVSDEMLQELVNLKR